MKENLLEHWQQAFTANGFEEPTEIQTELYGVLKAGSDALAISPTGTGKTVAYTLPILEKIEAKPELQWLVLAPSHELVMQIADAIRLFIEPEKKISVMPIIGGANLKRQLEKLKKKPQIIVASPGRLLELIDRKKVKMHSVQVVTLDEADQLLSKENSRMTMDIVRHAKRDVQLVLASATRPLDPDAFFRQFEREPVEIEVSPAKRATENVTHLYMEVENREKASLIRRITQVDGMQALVFVRDKPRMDILLEKLKFDGVTAAGIHGDLRKETRQKVLREFKAGKLQYLIVTDIAARGLDIPDLPYVIQYDIAESAREYTHRAGRTGRMGKPGTVLSFVNQRELRSLKQFLKELGKSALPVRFFGGKLVSPGEAKENKMTKNTKKRNR